jgi:intracellular septation protein
MTEAQAEPRKSSPVVRGAVDYAGPLGFLIAYFVTKDLVQATWVLVAVSALALAVGFAIERRIAPLPLMAGGAALVFGLLTVVFNDPTFVKIKPTVVNFVLGSALFIGLAMKKNPLKALMGDALKMTDEGWRKLSQRYGLFFWAMAVLNEVVRNTQSDAVWVVFRMPGLPLLAAVFAVTQVPAMLKDAKALEAALRAAETQD